MSKILINAYLAELDKLQKLSGTNTEQVTREAFKDLLKNWAKANDLVFIPELVFDTPAKTKVYPDGTILHELRVPLGFWEAKDTNDDLDEEITKKFKKGYPQENIIFENTATAILWQNGAELIRCDMKDADALSELLNLFFGYERPEIADFRKAVTQFKTDLPVVLGALREKISEAYIGNAKFKAKTTQFLKHAKETINPTLAEADIKEMLIQHILTEEIFAHVFNEGDFHRENNIAKELYALEALFFTGGLKKETLNSLQPYYAAIRANAAQISSHNEKQTFLKVIYENFYKVYNPKAADRLGVVYTPNEIVRFMIEGADWLCDKHFGKTLIDEGVDILDPAAGTGTFICELIEHFRGQPDKIHRKFKQELHANEVAILPYYVANLNIEATYAAVSGQYAEYPNLCFVDTLDNVAGLGIKSEHQSELFGAVSAENVERVNRQNERNISVVIGNPPYNANQQNENENNKNRAYPKIDDLIKRSFVRLSTAQKTKVYDMYARFFRWSFDRLHDEGIVAFITNRSFIDSRTFDGFRHYVAKEFNEIYVVDLGGDVRANPKLSGTKHNVFGIQTGVAISFFVKRKGMTGCKVFYARRPEDETAEDKLAFLGSVKASGLAFEEIEPSKKANWINQTENNWDDLIAVADKKTKATKITTQERTIFKLFTLGVVTNRDEWVYSFNRKELQAKTKHLIQHYAIALKERNKSGYSEDAYTNQIKWTRHLKGLLKTGRAVSYNNKSSRRSYYRPFVEKFLYFSDEINEFQYQTPFIWPENETTNLSICFTVGGRLDFSSFATSVVPSLTVMSLDANQILPRHRYTHNGDKIDNITDWALNQFQTHYGPDTDITKDDIFHYVYGVMHDPIYREKYAINLKREFPRIPFYPEFQQWADWGQRLMDLHINYESVTPAKLKIITAPDEKARDAGMPPKVMLKANKEAGLIILDSETQISGIPPTAWDYRLGNRSGLEWILDQYKEKKPKDPTIREKFNTYRFADYKKQVIDLIKRVTTVSIETMKITEAMKKATRD